MTDEDLAAAEAAVKAQRPVHWTVATQMLAEIYRLRAELAAARAELWEALREEQEEGA